MEILVKIDQREALRQGIDAPVSTARLGLNPKELSEDQRNVLADLLKNGHDVSHKISLLRPTMDDLRADLDRIIQAHEEKRAEKERRDAEYNEKVLQAIADAKNSTNEEPIGMDQKGALCHSSYALVKRTVVFSPASVNLPPSWGAEMSDSVREKLAEHHAAVDEARKQVIEAVKPDMLREVERARAVREEEERQQKAAYDALYARLPERLRARHADGFAKESEIEEEMRQLILSDAGFRTTTWREFEHLDQLTDEEHEALVEIRNMAPESAVVRPVGVWLGDRYRPAEYDDDPDTVDGDGDVQLPPSYRAAKVKWTDPSGIAVTTLVELNPAAATSYNERD